MRYFLHLLLVFLIISGTWYLVHQELDYADVFFFPVTYEYFGYFDLNPTFIAGKLYQMGEYDAIYFSRSFPADARALHPKWKEVMGTYRIRNFFTSYVNSPFYLWLLAPVTALFSSFALFMRVSVFVNTLACSVICLESLRLAGRETGLSSIPVALAAAMFYPFNYATSLGQNILPAAALCLLAFRCHERKDIPGAVGACVLLLLACACKAWLVSILAVFVYFRAWRIVLGTACSFFVFSVWMPGVLVHPTLSAGYRSVAGELVRLSLLTFNNISLRGLMHRLSAPDWGKGLFEFRTMFPPDWVFPAEAGVFLGGLMMLIPIFRKNPPGERTAFLCCLALSILPLGISWHHYVSCVFPAALFAVLSPASSRFSKLIGGGFLVFESLPFLPGCYYGNLVPETVMRAPGFWAGVFFLPTAFGVVLILSLLLSGGRTPEPAPSA